MTETGEVILCKITKAEEYGAYAITEADEVVFINFGELSWEPISDIADAVSLGDIVPVAIVKDCRPDRDLFLGSLKRANPESIRGASPFRTMLVQSTLRTLSESASVSSSHNFRPKQLRPFRATIGRNWSSVTRFKSGSRRSHVSTAE